jgi:hypothetical protein
MRYYNIIFYISVIIIIIIGLHLKDYLNTNNKYEILTIKYNKTVQSYFKENLPIIFTSLFNLDTIISPITTKQKYIQNLDYINYFSHSKDMLFVLIYDKISVELLIPKEINKFKMITKKNNIKILKNIDMNYKYIQVNLDKNNILSIPRFWIFKIKTINPSIKIYYTDTVFTNLFNIFY